MANTGDNYGAVLEALNDKMDRDVENRSTGVETVVETWHNGTEWYRVWSDGWIEQGGYIGASSFQAYVEKTLNKPFSNTNYTIQLTFKAEADGYADTAWAYYLEACYVTSTSFKYVSHTSTGLTRSWYACGY